MKIYVLLAIFTALLGGLIGYVIKGDSRIGVVLDKKIIEAGVSLIPLDIITEADGASGRYRLCTKMRVRIYESDTGIDVFCDKDPYLKEGSLNVYEFLLRKSGIEKATFWTYYK